MKILVLDDSHLEAVAHIETLCFSSPWTAKSLKLLLRDGNFALVAMEGEVVVGYVGVLLIPPDEFEITNVAVHPDFRRRGVGEALMRALSEKVFAEGQARISLEVRASNEAAIALYRKLGFSSCGLRKNYYAAPREDAIIMDIFFEGDERDERDESNERDESAGG